MCPPGDYPSAVITKYFVLQTGSWQVSTEALSALAHQRVALALSRNHIHRTPSSLNPQARPSIFLPSQHHQVLVSHLSYSTERRESSAAWSHIPLRKLLPCADFLIAALENLTALLLESVKRLDALQGPFLFLSSSTAWVFQLPSLFPPLSSCSQAKAILPQLDNTAPWP